MSDIKLSIITPYYNTLPYTLDLAKQLEPQLTDKVEWIIVDDGCNEYRLDKLHAKVIHLPENSGTASHPRNVGLDNARGEYIAFIDSDDWVSSDYVEKILKKAKVDLIYLSWQSKIHNVRMEIKPPAWNCSVWCRVYRREIIGDIRFQEDLKIAEDFVFNSRIKYQTCTCVKQTVYYYNNSRKGSLTNG